MWIEEFERNHPLLRPPSDLTSWCLRFTVDKTAMVLKKISLEHITVRLRAAHANVFVVHTAESCHHRHPRVPSRRPVPRGTGDEDKAREALDTILATPVRGIQGIMSAKIQKITRHSVAPDGSLVKSSDIYAIRTIGHNLFGVLTNTAIDPLRAVSSSIGDTAKLFGIEAARNKIIRETQAFMEDGAPNARHLMQYADEMTRLGRVVSLERSGLSVREHNNVLLRMAYGAPIQVVTDATLGTAMGRVTGISGPLLLGSVPQIGTLYNQIVVNNEFVSANTVSVDTVLDTL